MKAYRLNELNRELDMEEIPDPDPGENEVVLEVKATGLCHSDLHFISGQIKVPVPLTLGHETAGVIIEKGSEVRDFEIGDRVAIYLGDADKGAVGAAAMAVPGITTDGGLAEKVKVHSKNVVRIPDKVSWEAAAVATDAIATSYHAVKQKAKVKKGDIVGVIGLGGLGWNGMKIAQHLGGKLIVADPDTKKTEQAIQAGVEKAVPDFLQLKGEDPDVIIDFVGIPQTIKAAQKVVKAGGRIVIVGLGALKAEIHVLDLASRELSLIGSFGSLYSDLQDVMQLLADEVLKLKIETIGFDQVNSGILQRYFIRTGRHILQKK
jgi:2-desacetyl-2-hydroxyethyl bacteriochlorophyllide A dehydrogenase